MDRQHYRRSTTTTSLPVFLPKGFIKARKRAGDFRTAPFVLALDTSRWYQRCPEQFNLACKNMQGAFLVELMHSIRRPRYHRPIQWSRKRKVYYRAPDHYRQHTRGWRYNLDIVSHARAFQQLLRHSMAYVSGLDVGARRQGKLKDLYWLDIGTTKELARWPITALTGADSRGRPLYGLEGFEVLEVQCLPGERPTRPKTICGPRPRDEKEAREYDAVRRHWHKEIQGCRSKRLQLRIRRVHGPHDEPAFYFDNVSELDLPLRMLRAMQRQLPGFWKMVYNVYRKEAGIGWPRTDREDARGKPRHYDVIPVLYWKPSERQKYYWAPTIDEEGHVNGRHRREHAPLEGPLSDQRQFNWRQEIVQRFLHPSLVASFCCGRPQDGLWKKTWTDELQRGSEEYLVRLALWEAGMLWWDPEWTVDIKAAFEDLQRFQAKRTERLTELLQTFLVACAIKFRRTDRIKPTHTEPLKLSSYQSPSSRSARAPPLPR